MDKRQKKIIIGVLIGFVVIVSFIGIAMWIYGFLTKDKIAQIFGTVTSFISPSFLFGFCVKFITNKIHLKKLDQLQQSHKEQIEEVLTSNGIKLSKIEKLKPQTIKIDSQPYFKWNDMNFYLSENVIYIEFTPKNGELETYKYVFSGINEFKENIRKQMKINY